jgi:hypothetical protein
MSVLRSTRAFATFTMLALTGLSGLTGGCGGASTHYVPDVASAESLSKGPRAESAKALAPNLVAEANLELAAAKKDVAAGDEVTAALHAQRSVAAMQRAFVVARLAKASADETQAKAASADASAALQKTHAERAKVEADVDELEKKLRIAREVALPPESGATDPARAAARLRAAASLVAEARLLCGAARLLDPQAKGLAEAETAVTEADAQIKGPAKPAAAGKQKPLEPIDSAGRARVGCLAALTQGRRGTGETSQRAEDPDVLFAELSASAAQRTPSSLPARDERGVMLTFRDVWKGSDLTETGKQALAQVALVARSHANVGVQLVVHESETRPAAETQKKIDTALAALEAGGVPKGRLRGENAGASINVVSPADSQNRGRNARLDVVFVTR